MLLVYMLAALAMAATCVYLARKYERRGRGLTQTIILACTAIGLTVWFMFGIIHIILSVFVVTCALPALKRQPRPDGSHEAVRETGTRMKAADSDVTFPSQSHVNQRFDTLIEALSQDDEQLRRLAGRGRGHRRTRWLRLRRH